MNTTQNIDQAKQNVSLPALTYESFDSAQARIIIEAAIKGAIGMRPRNYHKIDLFARQMADSLWMPETAEPIKFNTQGLLMDGFHRLLAVIKSGKKTVLCVARNVPKEALPLLDTGSSRSASHVLAIMGKRNTGALAAAVRAVWCFERKNPNIESVVSNQDLVDTLGRHGMLESYVSALRSETFFKSGSIFGTLFWIEYCDQGESFVNGFIHGAIGGQTLPVTSPVYLLRERLIHDRSKLRGFEGRKAAIATMFRVFHQYRKATSLSYLKIKITLPDLSRYPWPEGAPYLPSNPL